jgi:hypothetical protein
MVEHPALTEEDAALSAIRNATEYAQWCEATAAGMNTALAAQRSGLQRVSPAHMVELIEITQENLRRAGAAQWFLVEMLKHRAPPPKPKRRWWRWWK